MIQFTEAIYEGGVFRPLEPLTLVERTHVFLQVANESAICDSELQPAEAELSQADFDRLLDELATDGPGYAGTFTRAEIYADHD